MKNNHFVNGYGLFFANEFEFEKNTRSMSGNSGHWPTVMGKVEYYCVASFAGKTVSSSTTGFAIAITVIWHHACQIPAFAVYWPDTRPDLPTITVHGIHTLYDRIATAKIPYTARRTVCDFVIKNVDGGKKIVIQILP